MTSALITALILSLTAAIIGWFIKNSIWKKREARSPAEHGLAWAAYIAFFVPLSSIHLFIRKEFIVALIGFASSLIIFPAVFFVCGYAYGLWKTKRIDTKSDLSDAAYETALSELESNSQVKSSWAKALAKSDGDEAKARATYIKNRVIELTSSKSNHPEEVSISDANTGRKSLLIGLAICIFLVIVFFISSSNSGSRATHGEPSLIQQQTLATPSKSIPNQAQLPASSPSIIGQWSCLAGEDVIDTFEETGIHRRLWVKQGTEFVYRWKIVKEGDDYFIDETEIGESQIHKKIHILSASSEQLELVPASGVLGRCKIIKPKKINSASTPKQESNKSPILKQLIGKWEMADGGWTFEYKVNGTGEISYKDSQVCGRFLYSVKDTVLSESNFSGSCKHAGGTDTTSSYSVQINGDSMTMKHSNGYVSSWKRLG